jgi:flagellar biosynthesis/type III secretory pathway chaperone
MTTIDASLQAFVDQQLPLSHRLLLALQNEERALIDNDVDSLELITREKNLVVNLFLTAQQQLARKLQQLGQLTNTENIRAWLESQPKKSSKNEQALIKSLQASAQEINRSNGILIQRLSSRNQAGLSALNGQREASIYGPTGQNDQPSSFKVVV